MAVECERRDRVGGQSQSSGELGQLQAQLALVCLLQGTGDGAVPSPTFGASQAFSALAGAEHPTQ